MFRRHIPKYTILLFIGDVVLISLALFIAPLIRFKGFDFETMQYTWEGVWLLFVYLFVFYLANLYDKDIYVKSARYFFTFMAALVVAALIEGLLFYLSPTLRSGRGVFILSVTLVGTLTYTWRLLLASYLRRRTGKKRLIIVGCGAAGRAIFDVVKDDSAYEVIGFIDDEYDKHDDLDSINVLGDTRYLDEMVKKHAVDIVVISIAHLTDKELVKCALDCKMEGVEVLDMPSFYELLTSKVPVEHVDDLWFLNTAMLGVIRSAYNRKGKRVLDVVASSVCLVVSLPVLVLASIFILIEAGFPIFYRQKRVGLNNQAFDVIKLRSMKVVMDAGAGESDDESLRITRVGRVIRKFRIDEIPQTWNVLKGDMSFIGPRALMVNEVEEFGNSIPYFALRHSVRPGITGWAQVNYPHGTSVEDALEKLKYDFFYIKNLAPLLEFHILLRTIKVVLFGKGAK